MMCKWKEASTLILVSVNTSLIKSKWNYEVITLKRNNLSRFMPSANVFPGGATQEIDFDEKWIEHLSQFNLPCTDSQIFNHFPSIFQGKTEGKLSKLVSLKITAIRETFEETGILLCLFKNKHSFERKESKVLENIREWRVKVQKNSTEFFNLCQFYQCCPDIKNLHIWSNWLTPSDMKKRFDTAFFISFLEYQPMASADEMEIETLIWLTPDRLIKMYNDKKIWLPPPQLSTQNFERWMPQQIKALDGLISVLPGDDAYKKLKDFTTFIETDRISVTMKEFREKFQVLHRIELLNKFHAKLIIKNYKPSCDHVIPFLYSSTV